MNEQYQNPTNCGSPNKYESSVNVQNVGNSYSNNNVQNNAQSDVGFNASYGVNNAEGTEGKRYMCRNCGTMHYGNESPKNCCKCDSSDFKEV